MSNEGLKFHPQALSTAEVEALMAACSPTSPTGKRNRALIVAGWRGALRCEEALHLKVHDLDRMEIEPRWRPAVDARLAERKRLGLPREMPAFCTLAGAPLQDRYVRAMLAALRDKAGIRKRVHMEGLRYSRKIERLRDVRKRTSADKAS